MDTKSTMFSKDKSIVILLLANFGLIVTSASVVVLRLRSNDFKVPVQYIANDGSVVQASSWYSLYSLGFFAVLSVAAIFFLAYRLYRGNPTFSKGLLGIQLVVSIITLLVINSLLSLVARV